MVHQRLQEPPSPSPSQLLQQQEARPPLQEEPRSQPPQQEQVAPSQPRRQVLQPLQVDNEVLLNGQSEASDGKAAGEEQLCLHRQLVSKALETVSLVVFVKRLRVIRQLSAYDASYVKKYFSLLAKIHLFTSLFSAKFAYLIRSELKLHLSGTLIYYIIHNQSIQNKSINHSNK